MTHPLTKKAVLATLKISSWGTRRFDEEAAEETLTRKGADKNAGLFTKRLLNKKAMKDIRAAKHEARAYHKKKTVPWLHKGTDALPTDNYLEYRSKMEEIIDRHDAAVLEFLKKYPTYIQEAKKDLGSLFDPNDYPPAEVLKHRFSIRSIISPMPDPGDFRAAISGADMDEIKADLEKVLDEQLQTILKDVGARIADVVGHMVERLKAYKPGNKKKGTKAENTFRDSLVSNIQELVEMIPTFNLTNDPKLTEFHKRMSKELCMVDAEALREDDVIRKKVLISAEKILKDVSAFIA